MDLLIVMIILLAFLLQNDSLDLKGRIREFFQPKETGGMRPDADYGNIHPEGTAEEKKESTPESEAFQGGEQFEHQTEKKSKRRKNVDRGDRNLKKSAVKIGKIVGVVLALAVIAVCALDSFYMLNENTYAVVTTFGSPSVEKSAGLHFKLPFIQRVHKITKNIMGMPIGYTVSDESNPEVDENNPQSVTSESEMITKDFNFVNVDFYIEYQVTDPIQAFTHADTYQEIIKNLAQSYIRDTVGTYNVDDVITTGKSEIQAQVKEKLSNRLEAENIGYGIYNVTIQDAQPPTAEVTDAFKAVEDAKQGMDTAINEAKKYQSEQIPTANAKADQLIQDAEAYKQEKISEATGQAARFNDLYEEYSKYPLITKKRMFYEAMEEVLPDLKVIINSSDGTQTVLPLEPFVGTSAATASSGTADSSGTSGAAQEGQSQTQNTDSQNGGNGQ